MGLSAGTELQLVEVNEGSEVCEFWDGLGGDKKKKQHLFVSLLDCECTTTFFIESPTGFSTPIIQTCSILRT